jgi:hypothetical protein
MRRINQFSGFLNSRRLNSCEFKAQLYKMGDKATEKKGCCAGAGEFFSRPDPKNPGQSLYMGGRTADAWGKVLSLWWENGMSVADLHATFFSATRAQLP